MTGVTSSLIYYRLLHELRRVFHRQSPIRPKIGFICSAVLVPSSIFFSGQLSLALFRNLPPGLNPPSFCLAGALAAGLLFYLFSIPELFRETAFAQDKDLLRGCPVLPCQIIPYRLLFSFLRVMHFSLLLISFPMFCLWLAPQPWRSFSLLTLLVYFACLFLSAHWSSLELIRLSQRLGFSYRVAFILLSLCLVLAAAGLIPFIFDLSAWASLTRWFGNITVPRAALPLFLPVLSACGFLICRRTARIWTDALELSDVHGSAARSFPSRGKWMPEGRSRAIAQKDLKILWRDPGYRYAILASSMLLGLCLLAEWRQSSPPHSRSWRRMMGSLSLIYLIPLLISGRAVSIELRIIEFYRLTFPRAGRLLDLKWMTQSMVNCLLVAALAVPYFLMVSPGARPNEGSYFVACEIACVPLLTLLAITLGALFPSTSQPPNPIGIRPVGIAAYIVLSVTLYSFLLNYMLAGAVIYAAFLLPSTLVFYLMARRSLSGPK